MDTSLRIAKRDPLPIHRPRQGGNCTTSGVTRENIRKGLRHLINISPRNSVNDTTELTRIKSTEEGKGDCVRTWTAWMCVTVWYDIVPYTCAYHAIPYNMQDFTSQVLPVFSRPRQGSDQQDTNWLPAAHGQGTIDYKVPNLLWHYKRQYLRKHNSRLFIDGES